MALEFDKISPIRFGDFEATPKLTASLRLRASKIKLGGDNEEAMETLSQCFGNKSEDVLAFMKENMSTLDLQRLQAYIVGGDQMLDNVDEAIKEALQGAAKGANEKA